MPHIFMKQGRGFSPIDRDAIDLYDTLPPGTYTVQATPMGYQVEKIDDFDLPPKLYGDTEQRARRILRTFQDRPAVTGVLLSGQKGSGKTMLAKRIAQIGLQEQAMITLVINSALRGEGFNTFLQNITQPAIVLFDEFEKTYDRDQQEELLTIFDGTYASKKLFLLTCNDKYKVGQYMHNRPGRIFYALEYGGLDRSFIEEYCKDNLKNLAHARGVETVAAHFNEFSFDMLKALVEEMNRYGETAGEAMVMLNMSPRSDEETLFDVTMLYNGRPVDQLGYTVQPDVMRNNPLTITPDQDVCVSVFKRRVKRRTLVNSIAGLLEDDEEPKVVEPEETATDDAPFEDREYFDLSNVNIESFKVSEGVFVFKTDRPEVKIVLRRRAPTVQHFNYDAY